MRVKGRSRSQNANDGGPTERWRLGKDEDSDDNGDGDDGATDDDFASSVQLSWGRFEAVQCGSDLVERGSSEVLAGPELDWSQVYQVPSTVPST